MGFGPMTRRSRVMGSQGVWGQRAPKGGSLVVHGWFMGGSGGVASRTPGF